MPDMLVATRDVLEVVLRRLVMKRQGVILVHGTVGAIETSTDGSRIDNIFIRHENGLEKLHKPALVVGKLSLHSLLSP